MVTAVSGQGLAAAAKSDREAIHALARALGRRRESPPKLLIGGQEFELPAPVLQLLVQAADSLARGQVATFVPVHAELTTQEAADLLNVSRPYLVRLLDGGVIPCTRTGTHRRIRAEDVLAYKQARDAKRRAHLRRLVELSEELGLYEAELLVAQP